MKKILSLLLTLLLLLPVMACAESQFIRMIYAGYDGTELFGQAEVPDGVFFVRASFFLPDGSFFVMIIPIGREGLFQLDISVTCASVAVGIVDTPDAIVPDYGPIYQPMVVPFIEGD